LKGLKYQQKATVLKEAIKATQDQRSDGWEREILRLGNGFVEQID
jgi:hypothetical protein